MTIGIAGNRVSLNCNGVTTVFPIPLQAYLPGDFTVILTTPTGAQLLLVLNSDYALTPASTDAPPKWTLTTLAITPFATGYTLQAFVNPGQINQTQYIQGQAFPSLAVQTNIDRLTQMVQRLQDQVNRSIRAPDGDLAPGMLLPVAALRQLQYLATDANGNVTTTAALPGTSNTAQSLGLALYPQTAAELAAGVMPTNYAIASHLAVGSVLPERYGGAGDNSTLNDIPHSNALKVANAVGDGTVVYGNGITGIWKFNAPITIGATGQGRRVVGIGRPEFSFNAFIASTLDLITISANLNSLYQDQPQFDNIQINCNAGGRDGVVLTVGNRPLIRNIRIDYPGRDGYVESTTAPNWIEKAEVSVLVRFAGRNGFRQEILGAPTTNPFINEGNYYFEVRGVSAITAGGVGLRLTGSAGLGGAAKIADNVYRTVFDAIYNTGSPIPATSPVISDTIVVQNATFNVPAWENTGTGGNPGAGPMIKVNSGSWTGLNVMFPNWNSFWGDSTFDAAIVQVNRFDFSFNKVQLSGPVSVAGNNTSGVSTAADYTAVRTGVATSPGPLIGQDAETELTNSTSVTSVRMQQWKGNLVIFTSPDRVTWTQRLMVKVGGGLLLQGASTLTSGTGAPAGGLAGDYYLRQDTPGTANQRLYVCTAPGAWTGII